MVGSREKVTGYEAFISKLNEMEKTSRNAPLVILFSGSIDPATGQSWCPDCVTAEPIIDAQIQNHPEINFLHVSVGERDYWKSESCDFRTNPDLKLRSIPTLMKWKSPQKLDMENVIKSDLIAMLMEDD